MLDQSRAPLWEAVQKHIALSKGNYHVPGHKQGVYIDQCLRERWEEMFKYDLTEVGGLDDLHHPTGAIFEAEQLAAAAFGAERTFFLVGGTTAGNIASIFLAAAGRKKVVIQRDSHQSIYHAAMLAQADVILLPQSDRFSQRVDPRSVSRLLAEHHDIGAVVVTSPSYEGQSLPIAAIAEVCHHSDIPLFVDEAHGAHLSFHPRLSPSALEAGADLVVQSTHKMLSAMTMASMLHVRTERVDVQRLAHYLRMIESSSPSYPLMISLDLTRRQMVLEGEKKVDSLLVLLEQFRVNVASLLAFTEVLVGKERDQDPCKFSLQANGLTGFQLANMLENKGIFVEWSNYESVLFVFTLGTTEKDLDNLLSILQEFDVELSFRKKIKNPHIKSIPISPKQSFTFADWQHRSRQQVPLQQAIACVTAELIVPYPPGVPLLVPGETWTEEHIGWIENLLRQGGQVHGIELREEPFVWVWIKEVQNL